MRTVTLSKQHLRRLEKVVSCISELWLIQT